MFEGIVTFVYRKSKKCSIITNVPYFSDTSLDLTPFCP